MTSTLRPPSTPTGRMHDGIRRWKATDLFRFVSHEEGQAIVKRNGTWGLEYVVAIDGAEEYFLGGHIHTLTDEQADELTLAGFGEYITSE